MRLQSKYDEFKRKDVPKKETSRAWIDKTKLRSRRLKQDP